MVDLLGFVEIKCFKAKTKCFENDQSEKRRWKYFKEPIKLKKKT